MAQTDLVACGSCGNRLHSTDQRTCPHCLEPLEPKRFASESSLAAYRENRQAHGAHVEPVRPRKRNAAGAAFLFVAALMVMAGAGIVLGGLSTGGVPAATGAFYEAVLPLSMAAALAAIGYKVVKGSP